MSSNPTRISCLCLFCFAFLQKRHVKHAKPCGIRAERERKCENFGIFCVIFLAICQHFRYFPKLPEQPLLWHSGGQRFDPAYLHQKSGKLLVFRTFSCFYDNRFCPDNRLTLVFTLTAFCLLDPSVFIVSITSYFIFLCSKTSYRKSLLLSIHKITLHTECYALSISVKSGNCTKIFHLPS